MGVDPVNNKKKELRKVVRRGLCSMSGKEKLRESEAIWRRVESLEEFRSARVVALYWSLPDEPFTHDVAERWSRSKTILLPCVDGDGIILRRFESTERMREGRFCIGEPVGEVWNRPQDIDLVIVPGVAFSGDGGRVGRGKGFYDRFFARLRGEVPAPGPGTPDGSGTITATTMGLGHKAPDGVSSTPASGPTTADDLHAAMRTRHIATPTSGNNASDSHAVPGHTAGSASPTGLRLGRIPAADPFPGVFPVTVGVCFSCQVVPEVPREAHDIALDMVISG